MERVAQTAREHRNALTDDLIEEEKAHSDDFAELVKPRTARNRTMVT